MYSKFAIPPTPSPTRPGLINLKCCAYYAILNNFIKTKKNKRIFMYL